MNRAIRTLLISGLFLLLLGSVALAAPLLKATMTASQQTTLVWPFTAGDVIEYTLDGLTWTAVAPPGGADVRVATGDAVDGETTVIGLTDFTNYYFRINQAGTFSTTAVAYPPNEHAHKYFAADTNQCAGCHSTHVSRGVALTKTATIDGLCQTCHSGTGAKYQVDAGTVATATGTMPALGGPFGNTFNPSSTIVPTSSHQLGATLSTAPGGDPSDTNGKWSEPLGCASCHGPHSGPGYVYRILRKSLPNMEQADGTVLTSLAVEAYAVTGADKENAVYVSGMNGFCGGCHADYNTTDVVDSSDNTSGVFDESYYRHAVGAAVEDYVSHGHGVATTLPLEATDTGAFLSDGSVLTAGTVNCITCHKPHGVTTTNQSGSSLLLRMNNRGVCMSCHPKQ